ncbi:hypothetical protein F7725_018209 [Dissostichus mawsoni]|uniref:Sodium channel regulatory subunit beta-1 n=1 Tax=Dissostichus mawsoni TaxID=36200 RepID=A0A7J5XQZ4_DISMA|nr:hypothetical protein F7725_018209 [Dissostichus mawsoni]
MSHLLLTLALLALQACLCRGACVEVDSNTEAVEKKGFKLGCISCKKRGEVPASAFVDWYFSYSVDHNFTIYQNKEANITDERSLNVFNNTNDLQDGSIFILNVTFNDTGLYRCIFSRTLMYPAYEFSTFPNKTIDMKVVPELTRGWASILSEVMMYVSHGLQVWLVIEMIYCYRKISVAGEEALRESAPEYLAIASESKDNCAAVQCHGGCAEVDSMTEAVAGEGFLLGCISCKKREEVSARATIFHYEHPSANIVDEDFSNRLEWHGTKNSDIQIGAIYIHNVTFNETGTFRCTIHRTLFLRQYNENVTVEKEVELTVVAVANRELTSVIAEIMMYVLIVVLQLWLIGVLIYCYKKISEEYDAREAHKALKAQAVLAKDNCDGVQLE